jgi:hypothetical protein
VVYAAEFPAVVVKSSSLLVADEYDVEVGLVGDNINTHQMVLM